MFGIGFLEICVIGVVGLILIGPKKLPELIIQMGKIFVQMRRVSNEVKSSLDDIVSEVQVSDVNTKKNVSRGLSRDFSPCEKAYSTLQDIEHEPKQDQVSFSESEIKRTKTECRDTPPD
ncbi:MAG: hypothetical protein CMP11_04350 [Zetaproteobacteria bacterium]|nr:hypothetical protein [Pseudobdellovibrionaceae bacterium]|tara:strand:- start:881 stop:1237 length:357 start_codon:yes stop_codon:yes gene_type:complete